MKRRVMSMNRADRSSRQDLARARCRTCGLV